jgi:predicted transcriptional regulator
MVAAAGADTVVAEAEIAASPLPFAVGEGAMAAAAGGTKSAMGCVERRDGESLLVRLPPPLFARLELT